MTRAPGIPRRTRCRHSWPPEKAHLIGKNGAVAARETTPEKSHRNRRGIKNVNRIRYLCANGRDAGPALLSPKSLTFAASTATQHLCEDSRKSSPVPKSGTAEIGFLPLPAGFSANSTGRCSRKASPVHNFCAQRSPENPHLSTERRAVIYLPKKLTLVKPASANGQFISRKPSPSCRRWTSTALLLCKMAVRSRKSSQQILVQSRETSPLA